MRRTSTRPCEIRRRALPDRPSRRLRWPGAAQPVRSQSASDYAFALETLQKTDILGGILEPRFFQGFDGEACGERSDPNHPHMALNLAAHLLTRPGSQAKYVNVVDGGLITASGGGGYDTHTRHVRDSGRNLTNLWRGLIGIINEPGEADPTKLNLDETQTVPATWAPRRARGVPRFAVQGAAARDPLQMVSPGQGVVPRNDGPGAASRDLNLELLAIAHGNWDRARGHNSPGLVEALHVDIAGPVGQRDDVAPVSQRRQARGVRVVAPNGCGEYFGLVATDWVEQSSRHLRFARGLKVLVPGHRRGHRPKYHHVGEVGI